MLVFALQSLVFPPVGNKKYLVKRNSSSWFSAAWVATVVHRNNFFCLYQENRSSESKVKFRQASKMVNS